MTSLLLMIPYIYIFSLASTRTLNSPERDVDGDAAVNGYGQQAEDGALSEHQHEAGHEQTAVEVRAEACADCDGKGDCQDPHGDVGHRQWHHKEVGDALEVAVEAHGPADQHIAQHGEAGDQELQDDVENEGDSEFRHGEAAGEVTDESLFSTVIAAAPGHPTDLSLKSQKTQTSCSPPDCRFHRRGSLLQILRAPRCSSNSWISCRRWRWR